MTFQVIAILVHCTTFVSMKNKILSSWEKQSFEPVYWFQGEEDYDIDVLVQYAEKNILSESESTFNLSVFYGKDAQWQDILNACRTLPMMGKYQVVILKEAQQMKDKDLESLEPLIAKPVPSTIFIVAYKGKSLDKRKSFTKTVAKHAVVMETVKLRDEKVVPWIIEFIEAKGFKIQPKSAALIAEHIGNDLSRITNEIEKLLINLKNRKKITDEDIETYIGISKEYNVFALQAAIAQKNLPQALTIVKYFEGNPKAGPLQLILPTIYAHFSKIYVAHGLHDKSVNGLKAVFHNYYFANEASVTLRNYSFTDVERVILLLHQYNLKSIGVGDTGTSHTELLKEMIVKMIMG